MNKEFFTLVKDYQEIFGLSNWVIRVEIKPISQNAKTVADPRYNRATITFSPSVVKQRIEWGRVIIHELIHIILAMYDFYVDNEIENKEVISVERESAVSQLGEIFLRLRGE